MRLLGWWKDIQPPTRLDEQGKLRRVQLTYDQWTSSEVFRPGRYGIRLMVVAVAWLGVSVSGDTPGSNKEDAIDEDGNSIWETIADDVTWSLQQMVALRAPIPPNTVNTSDPNPKT